MVNVKIAELSEEEFQFYERKDWDYFLFFKRSWYVERWITIGQNPSPSNISRFSFLCVKLVGAEGVWI